MKWRLPFSRRTLDRCAEVRPLLGPCLGGELPALEAAAVRAHVAGCSACADELSALEDTVALLRALPRVAAPRSFAIVANVPMPEKPNPFAALFGPRPLGAATAFASLAFVVTLTLSQFGTPALSSRTTAPLSSSAPAASVESPAYSQATTDRVPAAATPLAIGATELTGPAEPPRAMITAVRAPESATEPRPSSAPPRAQPAAPAPVPASAAGTTDSASGGSASAPEIASPATRSEAKNADATAPTSAPRADAANAPGASNAADAVNAETARTLAAGAPNGASDSAMKPSVGESRQSETVPTFGAPEARSTDGRIAALEVTDTSERTFGPDTLAAALGGLALALGLATLVSWRVRAGRGSPRSGGS